MPVSLCGTWDMVSNVNFERYMIALGKSAFFCTVKLIIAHNSVALFYCMSAIIDPKLSSRRDQSVHPQDCPEVKTS